MNGGWANCPLGWLKNRIWEATWDNRDDDGKIFLHTWRMFLAARPCHTADGVKTLLHRVNTGPDAAKLTRLANGSSFIEAPIYRSSEYERTTRDWPRATHATCFSNIGAILDVLALLESDTKIDPDCRALSDGKGGIYGGSLLLHGAGR